MSFFLFSFIDIVLVSPVTPSARTPCAHKVVCLTRRGPRVFSRFRIRTNVLFVGNAVNRFIDPLISCQPQTNKLFYIPFLFCFLKVTNIRPSWLWMANSVVQGGLFFLLGKIIWKRIINIVESISIKYILEFSFPFQERFSIFSPRLWRLEGYFLLLFFPWLGVAWLIEPYAGEKRRKEEEGSVDHWLKVSQLEIASNFILFPSPVASSRLGKKCNRLLPSQLAVQHAIFSWLLTQ